MAAIATAASVYMGADYVTLDPRLAKVGLLAQYPMKYPVLVAHVASGTIALITVVLQVWPWLRRRHPRVHRWVGRLYVFGGVAPSAGLAAVLLRFIAQPPWLVWVARVILEVLWVTTTLVGVVAARRRNVVVHRRFMLFSFALTMDAFSTRFIRVVLGPLSPDSISRTTFLMIVGWAGWVTNILLVSAWLSWTAYRRRGFVDQASWLSSVVHSLRRSVARPRSRAARDDAPGRVSHPRCRGVGQTRDRLANLVMSAAAVVGLVLVLSNPGRAEHHRSGSLGMGGYVMSRTQEY